MPFNILRLWRIPQKFTNRDAWRDDKVPDYRRLISGPMAVLAESHAVPAIVRYVEVKALIAGVTSGQGVTLQVAGQIAQVFRGVVRKVERPGDGLPAANTHVQDVRAKELSDFRDDVDGATCMLLHLAEGTDTRAHDAFLALKDPASGSQDWAIRPSLAAIHCTALSAQDLALPAHLGGAMVWSPLSNYLLYGQTAEVAAATQTPDKLRIGLGADWSPSGSKNLLGELKVARLCSDEHAHLHGAPLLSNVELVALATRNAASILGWGGRAGSVTSGARADLIVLAGVSGDPYDALLRAREPICEPCSSMVWPATGLRRCCGSWALSRPSDYASAGVRAPSISMTPPPTRRSRRSPSTTRAGGSTMRSQACPSWRAPRRKASRIACSPPAMRRTCDSSSTSSATPATSSDPDCRWPDGTLGFCAGPLSPSAPGGICFSVRE
jgi:hypothetical protein